MTSREEITSGTRPGRTLVPSNLKQSTNFFGKYEKLCHNLFRHCGKYGKDYFILHCDRTGKTAKVVPGK